MSAGRIALFYFLILLRYAVSGLSLLIIVRVILSWINPHISGTLYAAVRKITEPLLKPLRLVVVFGGTGLDLSPIIAILILTLLEKWLFNLILNF
jgi:YggT family protein